MVAPGGLHWMGIILVSEKPGDRWKEHVAEPRDLGPHFSPWTSQLCDLKFILYPTCLHVFLYGME